ncbi:rubredoxin [Tenuifilaceae bacterium CYCD]|nr:rubredoxin [Tenuifilaceae bacterium CYCD]
MYKCVVCGYCYFDENGDPTQEISPGTSFEDLPETWHCPVCNVTKEYFVEVEEP